MELGIRADPVPMACAAIRRHSRRHRTVGENGQDTTAGDGQQTVGVDNSGGLGNGAYPGLEQDEPLRRVELCEFELAEARSVEDQGVHCLVGKQGFYFQ